MVWWIGCQFGCQRPLWDRQTSTGGVRLTPEVEPPSAGSLPGPGRGRKTGAGGHVQVVATLLAQLAARPPSASARRPTWWTPPTCGQTPSRNAPRLAISTSSHRSNVLHLPVRGSGDGGAYTTVADIHRLWQALLDFTVLDQDALTAAWRPRSDVPAEGSRYGLGFWLHATGPGVMFDGSDAGVSFRTVHDPDSNTTHTVIANWSSGAWPVTRALDQMLLGW